jgi:tight adherence protein B
MLGFWIALMTLRSTVAAAIIGAAAGSVATIRVSVQRARRMRKFEDQFPQAVELIARALRAGHALPTGLGMVADEIPAPVGTEFRILFDEQNFGLTLPDALRNFAKRIPVLDARFFVTAVLTQREAGGNLAEVLDNLAAVTRERFKVRRQVRVLSAHGRITGWVLALLPPAIAGVTAIISPGHLGTLISDPLGQRMIAVAAVLQLAGMLAIRRLVDIDY